MEKLKKGQRVQHTGESKNLGLGQLLEDENAREIRVCFVNRGIVNLGISARSTLQVVTGAEAHSDFLDNLVTAGDKPLVTLDSAKQRFQKLFIGGFYGKRLLEEERNYKDELARVAQQLLAEDVLLPLMESGNYQQVCDQAKKLISHPKNIQPSHFEKMAFNDGLKTLTDAEPFARSFFDFLHGHGELEPRFNRFAQVLEQMDADKWPIITVFRFFLFPATDACIKPEHLKNAAELCHFELNYKPRPNWLTYYSVTKFYQYLFNNLANSTDELKPRDMIDVQSFIWCIDPESYPGE